ncbi:regulatory protein TetR [Gordonia bronchialis DSM 43247]|uniref:Regulatory protein TetR n=1 Tax=Gordonia bronchialis (strain ATCC 25592 / DSM 43247 / BCRC 13721 / JCM 3198 / KCTC 3076 / NBRC 16047 / NCTC 10667) TaxID=526226 RepID=D0L767_GORB4|nr:regulatory protein TetR [Gordonia bronchialis DSM 43247]STQ63689.1 HTH-type transcriptional repressor fabR [Gordonia bronchialis]
MVSRTRHSTQRETQSRADKKNQTRQALLDTTMTLVGDRSFGSISLREVARGAGIVPTAFYRHFASMEDLGVTLVEDSMRVLRRTLREGRRDLASRQALPTAQSSLAILLRHVRENEPAFRFLVREQHGGIAEVRRAIDTELRLFAKELAIDLARMPDLARWDAEDLELAAELIVTIMLTAVADLLDGEYRGRVAEREVVERTERQLVMVFLGMGQWKTGEGRTGAARAAES